MPTHTRAAGSFPFSHLRQDRITAALVRIRTDPNKVLIVYDDDERQAQAAALLLLGKNYPNVAILTGGTSLLFSQRTRTPLHSYFVFF